MKTAPPPPEDSNPEQPATRKKNEKGASPTFWYLLIGSIVLIIGLTWFRESQYATPVRFSEFVEQVESGKLNSSNVHELVVNSVYLTYQDLPKKNKAATDKLKSDKLKSGNETSADPETAEVPNTSNQNSDENSGQNLSETEPPVAATDPVEPVQQRTGQVDPLAPQTRAKQYRVTHNALPEDNLTSLLGLLKEKGIQYDGTKKSTDLGTLFSIIMMLALLVVFFLFLRKVGGAGQAMSFGRSRGKLYSDDEVRVTFGNVAGIDEAVHELREVVEFLRTPGKYQALGGRIPRGVLLVGPPGTGKTLLAKAVAGEARVPFFSLSGSDFVEMFVGVGAARVRDTFSQAAQKSPSIIFIDELDALGKVRGSGMQGGHDEREQTLNALLVEMDGFSSDQSVIVMGATNRPETLDPALMRPGRFDRHVLVDKPDYKGRNAILNVHTRKIKLDQNVDLTRIARLTPGYVGADLANLVNEAALLAARNNKSAVSMVEFEEAVERVLAGLEKSSKVILEEEKQRVAYHECGHALVACSLPQTDPVHKISIIPRGFGALGYMLQRPQDDRHLITQSEIRNRICVMLGGIAAEDVVFEETSTGAQNDLERATDLARRMVMEFGMSPKLGRVNYRESKASPFLAGSSSGAGDSTHSEQTLREIDLEIRRIIDESMEISREILRTQRAVLEQMTAELIEVEVMNSDQLKRILDAHKTGPQLKPGTSALRTTQLEDPQVQATRLPLKPASEE